MIILNIVIKLTYCYYSIKVNKTPTSCQEYMLQLCQWFDSAIDESIFLNYWKSNAEKYVCWS